MAGQSVKLAQAIQTAQQTNEEKLRTSLNVERPTLSDDQRSLLAQFERWCAQKGVKACPAAPAAVAAYLATLPNPDLEAMVQAIAALHDYYNLANPTATHSTRLVLERRLRVEPPRSFSKQDRELFRQSGCRGAGGLVSAGARAGSGFAPKAERTFLGIKTAKSGSR
jgi:hypothetical protein